MRYPESPEIIPPESSHRETDTERFRVAGGRLVLIQLGSGRLTWLLFIIACLGTLRDWLSGNIDYSSWTDGAFFGIAFILWTQYIHYSMGGR